MEKRLKNYLLYLQNLNIKQLAPEQKTVLRRELLIQIGFFQHERLIHLLVTVTFAVLLMLAVLGCYLDAGLFFFLLALMLLVLLIPYIRHYYFLENGVQKLYGFYDESVPR